MCIFIYIYIHIVHMYTLICIYLYGETGMQCGKSHRMLVVLVERVMGVLATFLCVWNLKYGTFQRKGEMMGI